MDLPLLFIAKKYLSGLLLPPAAPLLLIALGLLLVSRRARLGRGLAWAGLLLAVLTSAPLAVGPWVAQLEPAWRALPPTAAQAEAVVVLAGGKRRYAPEYGGMTINALTLERLRYGVRLARRYDLPILVTGGAPTQGASEAELMATALRQDWGMEARWVETRALDTADNARYAAGLLHAEGIRRILLVTHAAHMPRAQAEFRSRGFEVVAAATAWQSNPDNGHLGLDLLPDPAAAYTAWYAGHEALGLLARQLRQLGD